MLRINHKNGCKVPLKHWYPPTRIYDANTEDHSRHIHCSENLKPYTESTPTHIILTADTRELRPHLRAENSEVSLHCNFTSPVTHPSRINLKLVSRRY